MIEVYDKKKIVILFEENYKVRRGSFNATLNRIKYLKAKDLYDIDVYCVLPYTSWLMSILRKTPKVGRKESYVDVDGIHIHIKWVPFTLIDYFLEVILHKTAIIKKLYTSVLLRNFKEYDLISAHSTMSGSLALQCYKKYGTPYTVTWHGSDIHTLPLVNKSVYLLTRDIINNAAMNFFVSGDLLKKSDNITEKGNKMVLYNGVDKTVFYKKAPSALVQTSKNLNINNNVKNIAFVGNFLEIKNVKLLPDIFKCIQDHIQKGVCFHFIGGGKFEQYLRTKCVEYSLNTNFIINASEDIMPDIYNLMDLVVLPSVNEGLPLVAVESLACGTLLVGSKVGGISEVVGDNNTISLDDNFVNRFADLCIRRLMNPVQHQLSTDFDWELTAQKEINIYNNIILS